MNVVMIKCGNDKMTIRIYWTIMMLRLRPILNMKPVARDDNDNLGADHWWCK